MARRPSLPALLIVLALLLGGCAQTRDTTGAAPRFVPPGDGPGPSASLSPGPVASPVATTAVPTPTRSGSTKPKPAPSRSPLPKGLKRTTGARSVALTFDDGPHPAYTPQVLDQLKAARVKATFCVVGVNVKRYPSLVARIVREGHNLCNHSWHHDLKLGTRSAAEIRADLTATAREIDRAAPDAPVRYYRQPGGLWTPALVKVVESLDMVPLHWDVDPRDWAKTVTAAQIAKETLSRARPGSIVLLHDGGGDRSRTITACPGIIRALKDRYGITRLK